MDVVYTFGNKNPQMQRRDANGKQYSEPAQHLQQTVTSVAVIPSTLDEAHVAHCLSTDNDRELMNVAAALAPKDRAKYALLVHHAEKIVGAHAAGVKPAWVDSNDPEVARVLGKYFNCPVGEPTAVLSNGGRDALHEQHLKKASQPAGFQYGALSASSHVPAAGDTTLAEEITTAEGGLLRAEMEFAHSAGTNTSTLVHTWAANSHDTLSVEIKLWANFNKVTSGGTMGEQDKLSATATLAVSGDSVTVTFTLTAG